MLAEILIDGLQEEQFRRSIEQMLRKGQADAAVAHLRIQLAGLCGAGRPLPARFLAISADDIEVTGWEGIAATVEKFARAGTEITAIGIDFSAPGHNGGAPDANGYLEPYIETNFYSDAAWPFSRCDHDSLLAGYSIYGSEWQGHFEHIDATIGFAGMADLYGAIVAMEYRCRTVSDATEEERRAHLTGACYLAVLAHLAVRNTIARRGLPRPMAVIVGSNESYPFFDAPVIDAVSCTRGEAESAQAPLSHDEIDMLLGFPTVAPSTSGPDAPAWNAQNADHIEPEADDAAYRSLLSPGATDEEQAEETSAQTPDTPDEWDHSPLESHVSGTQLRRRFVTAESIAETLAQERPNLFRRLLRRK